MHLKMKANSLLYPLLCHPPRTFTSLRNIFALSWKPHACRWKNKIIHWSWAEFKVLSTSETMRVFGVCFRQPWLSLKNKYWWALGSGYCYFIVLRDELLFQSRLTNSRNLVEWNSCNDLGTSTFGVGEREVSCKQTCELLVKMVLAKQIHIRGLKKKPL